MDWICPKCGTENKPAFKFCFACGEHNIDASPDNGPTKGAADPIIHLNPKTVAIKPPEPEVKPTPERTVHAAPIPTPTPIAENGWRCHECWKLNPESATKCDECGTAKRASERADRHDRAFGIFGKIGKWPVVIVFLLAIGGSLAWLYYYLNPKHGDVIAAPAGLESAVRASIDQLTTREIDSSIYFNCFSTTVGGRSESGGYAAFVTLVPRSTNITNANIEAGSDKDQYWQIIAHREGYDWKVERFAIADTKSVQDPCVAR